MISEILKVNPGGISIFRFALKTFVGLSLDLNNYPLLR